jgi:hypothetical protein
VASLLQARHVVYYLNLIIFAFTSDPGYRACHDDHDDHGHLHRNHRRCCHSHYNCVTLPGVDHAKRVGPGSTRYNRQDDPHEEQMVQRLDVHRSRRWSHNAQYSYYEGGILMLAHHAEQLDSWDNDQGC